MQAAPPVSVRGSGGRVWVGVQAALFAAAAAAFVAWAAGWSLGWVGVATHWNALGVGLCALVVAIGVGAWQWRAGCGAVESELAWDGQCWKLEGCVGRVDVMIDLDRWMLLRFHPQASGPQRWVAFRAPEVGGAWHGLRAAVQGRAPQAASVE